MNVTAMKTALILILSITSVQVLTLYTIAEPRKSRVVINDLSLLTMLNQFDSHAFNTDINSNSEDLYEQLRFRFKDIIDYYHICNLKEWREYRVDSNYLAVNITETSKSKMIFKAESNAGTLYYGENWTSEYVWILFKWVRLRHINVGVS